MKTDAELNRLIAEHVTKPKQILVGKDHDPIGIAMVFEWEYPVIDYCTDSAAWGALLDWLVQQFLYVRFSHGPRGWVVLIIGSKKGDVSGVATTLGRALVLATLAADGVEVPE